MVDKLISDGSTIFVGGQDASKSPQEVPDDAYFTGVNVSTEKGVLRPRWGWDKRKIAFPSGGVKQANTTIKSYKDLFHTGKFQAATYYSVGTDYFLIVVISGQIYAINIATFVAQHVPLEGEQINPRADRINWSNAGKYLVLFDYPAFPVIIDGLTARRADPKKNEIPVSNIGGYNQNRLIIGNAGNEFTAGDPVGSLAAPDAPITFLEFLTPNSPYFGQVFQLNTNYNNDPITAVSFLQVVDTSTGIGPLLVATKEAIYSYLTQNPRNTWEAGQFGSVIVYNAGVAGPRAIVNLNSDVIFISSDGQARSLSMSRDEQGKWSKTPISREVQNWLKLNDPSLVKYSTVTYFNNKVFLSANPYRTKCLGINNEPLPDYASGGFAVLELDNISTLTKESAPAWAGLWTGVRPMDMVVVNNRAFVISKDGRVNEIYEVNPNRTYDTDGSSIRYVKSKITTREHDFPTSSQSGAPASTSFQNKVLHSLDLTLHSLKGDFKTTVRYRPDQSANFIDWGSFEHKAPWRICRKPFLGLNGLAGHSFINVNLGSPLGMRCDPVTGQIFTTFRAMQLEISLEGIYWELRGYRIKATMTAQNENKSSCNLGKSVAVPLECNKDWAIEGFNICQTQT